MSIGSLAPLLRYVIHSRLSILDIKVCIKIFPQGGSKLIVIVSRNHNIYQENRSHDDPKGDRDPASMHTEYSHYEILFGGVAVPTTEIQPGVLRCLIPGTYQNLASYKILNRDDIIIKL